MAKRAIVGGLIVLAIIANLCLFLYPTVSKWVNSHSQSAIVARYLDDVAQMDDTTRLQMLAQAHQYNRDLLGNNDRFSFSEEDWVSYQEQLDTGRGVMGILAIDKIDVILPIFHGTEDVVLQVGLGHLPGTSLPVGGSGTHALIAGHRGVPSATLLSDLDHLEEGDSFTIYVLGEALTYQVDQIDIVLPDDVTHMAIDPDGDYVTLVTCTPYGINSHRLLVRGHRTDTRLMEVVVHNGAEMVDKTSILMLFVVPIAPVLVAYGVIRTLKIRKGGAVLS